MAATEATPFLAESLVLLGAATLAVPVFKKLGLGSVLGYLAAGIAIGPLARIITHTDSIAQIAEFGVVLLLFIIGLELKPTLLWSLRRAIFLAGGAQVLITASLIAIVCIGLQFNWQASVIIGFAFALSSTAIALQIMQERDEMRTSHGRTSFSILLFQDVAIVPILALTSFLAPVISTGPVGLEGLVTTLGVVIFVMLVGRYGLNPLFQFLAKSQAREIMTAAALLVVLGAAWLMQVAGLSMALGSFLAGVLMAESSFRHQLEADIEPFRGLLMGLFFLSVGLSINLDVLTANWLIILLAAPLIMFAKAGIIYGLARFMGSSHNDSVRSGMLLAQCGEFGFVILGAAGNMLLLTLDQTSILIAIITVTMALTPLFILAIPRLLHHENKEKSIDVTDHELEESHGSVLMIGFGRFGQIVAQVLLARDLDVTIIDVNPESIRQASKFGFKIYFGDGTRLDVLRKAGADKVKAVVITTHDAPVTNHIVSLFENHFPNAKIYVRSFDRSHTLDLMRRNIAGEVRDTFESALTLGRMALEGLNYTPEEADMVARDVRARDQKRLRIQMKDGLYAGLDVLHKPLKPEPLLRPHHKAEALSPETERIASKEDNNTGHD
jgi:CPA2 family monovalent cation:H+ antiporter-2